MPKNGAAMCAANSPESLSSCRDNDPSIANANARLGDTFGCSARTGGGDGGGSFKVTTTVREITSDAKEYFE